VESDEFGKNFSPKYKNSTKNQDFAIGKETILQKLYHSDKETVVFIPFIVAELKLKVCKNSFQSIRQTAADYLRFFPKGKVYLIMDYMEMTRTDLEEQCRKNIKAIWLRKGKHSDTKKLRGAANKEDLRKYLIDTNPIRGTLLFDWVKEVAAIIKNPPATVFFKLTE
jgi:hypothetical protein